MVEEVERDNGAYLLLTAEVARRISGRMSVALLETSISKGPPGEYL